MKNLLFFLLLLPIAAMAQYQNAPNKLRLGIQTTGDGLIFRGTGSPSFTPTSNANAWFFLDTAAQVLYTHIGGTWVSLADTITSGGTVTLSGEVVGASNATKLDTVDRVIFDPTNGGADSTYKLTYNANDFTLHFGMGLGNQIYQMGQELYYPPCINKTASTIYAGQPVMIDTSGIIQGDRLAVVPAFANGLPANYIVGVAAHDIAPDAEGLVTWFGYVREVDESDIAASGVTLDVGDILYLSATPGKYSDTEPAAPAINSTIAIVVRKPNANNMTLLVRPWLNEKLGDLTDVELTGLTDGQVLTWDSINGVWEGSSKQDPLTGTGLVKSTGGTISYVTDNSADWNAAYNDRITGAAFTGSATKTLTLTQQDAGTVTASFTDLQGVTSVATGVGLTGGTITTTGTISADTTVLVSKTFLTNQGYTSNAGTVTSVATGVGLTGGTITSSGTISADTTVLVSKTFLTNQGYTNNVGTVTSIATSNGIAGGTITGSGTISLTGQASSLHNLMTNGIITRGDEGFIDAVTITAGTGISIANGDGVSGNPTITNSAPEATTARNVNATGEGVFRDEVGNELQFKKLVAGSNITLTGADSTITIASTASGTGTVTSITAGVGLNGGTITTSGTIDADTSVLSTVYALADTASVLRGLIPAGTNFGTVAANKVAFGAASGDTLTSDTDFHWDATNNRLGIGISSPAYDLSLASGIRTIGMPDVSGTNGGFLTIRASNATGANNLTGGTLILQSGTSTGFSGSEIIFRTAKTDNTSQSVVNTTTEFMRISQLGRLGINTQSPQRLLHISGEVRITDLTTDTPTRIVGADADGDLGEVTTGNGLTITSGALSVDTATIATVSAVTDTASVLRGLIPTGTNFGTVAANKVAFGAASGDTLTSNTNFHWDNTNGRLGIGETSPAAPLHLYNSGNSHLRFTRASVAVPFDVFVNESRVLTFLKPIGNVSTGNNTNFRFGAIGAVDSLNGFWNGFQLIGHSFGTPGGTAFPIMTIASRSATGWEPTDYEMKFELGNMGSYLGGVSFFSTNGAGSFVRFGTGTSEVFRVNTNNRLGLLTTAPSFDFSIGGNSARTIGTERHTTANTAGNNLTLKVGGATSGATDKNGGNLILESGVSTGTGSSNIIFETAAGGTSGTTDRIPVERMRINGAGNLGIKTSSPDSTLTVAGSGYFQNNLRVGGKMAINTTSQSFTLSFGGNVGASIGSERRTISGNGGAMSLYAGDSFSGGTDQNGGTLYLSSGRSTGTGTGDIVFYTSTPANTSGSSDNNLISKLIIKGNGMVRTDGGNFSRNAPQTITTNTTVSRNQNWIICNRAGTTTLTLPDAAEFTGREIMVKTIQNEAVESNASNVVPLAGGSAGTAILSATAGKWATLVSDGTNWIIMQAN